MQDSAATQERRKVARHRSLLQGKILINDRHSVIDCVVRNLSADGACVQVASLAGVPPSFELQIGDDVATRSCVAIWHSDKRIGVKFRSRQPAGLEEDAVAGTVQVHHQIQSPAQSQSDERARPASTEVMRSELLALRAALYEVPYGVVLLDNELRAQFINRAFRKMWRLPDSKADAKPAYTALLHHGRDIRAYDVPESELAAYIADRVARVRVGDPAPFDLRQASGEIIRFHCTALPNGGRMLSYTDVTDLVRDAAEQHELATTDSMTELHNRRHFTTLADAEWQRFQRYQRPLSLLIFDIDHFKFINDKLGHDAGDRAIVHLAELAREDKRPTDILARVGGDEFVMLLPETDIAQASVVAERLRQKVAASPTGQHGAEMKMTISIGVADATLSMPGIHALLKRADEALYQAKFLGRNKVSLANQPPVTKVAAE